MKLPHGLLSPLAGLLLFGLLIPTAQAQQSLSLRQSCPLLTNIALPDTTLSSAEVVEANGFTPPTNK